MRPGTSTEVSSPRKVTYKCQSIGPFQVRLLSLRLQTILIHDIVMSSRWYFYPGPVRRARRPWLLGSLRLLLRLVVVTDY